MIDLYNTHQLIAAIQGIDPRPRFLTDRYFPTNDATDIFATEKVLVEHRKGQRGLAPFAGRDGAPVVIGRAGQEMREYTPPTVAPSRVLTVDDVSKRGFGEALMANVSPEVRSTYLTVSDMDELGGYIDRREEAMAAEVMLTNGCVMKAVADDLSVTVSDELRFYTEASNPATMAFDMSWDDPKAPILEYLGSMARFLTSRGLPAKDLVCAPDVADAIINNEGVQKLLDNRRVAIGEAAPKLEADGAAIMCQLNVHGRMIDVISYDETYTDDSGEVRQYIPAGKVVMTAPGAGRKLYGAVTQLEKDDEMHTYSGRRVPHVISSLRTNKREIVVTSRPLLLPVEVNPFVAGTAVFEAE
ncbi:major capsid protein [Adlercreutzia caecimuris]|uniref:major capsid protein n=1 Tax=Adlercreutzia caecimuris TaxID=671266 RepID=UPI001C3E9F17|nr:major capsid protein [Adlercreutzia caecimuris]